MIGGVDWGARLRNRLRELWRVKSYGAAVFAARRLVEGPLIVKGKGWRIGFSFLRSAWECNLDAPRPFPDAGSREKV